MAEDACRLMFPLAALGVIVVVVMFSSMVGGVSQETLVSVQLVSAMRESL